MQYTNEQLKFIQENLLRAASERKQKEKSGFALLMIYSEFRAWVSHALLAGWSVEQDTNKMYRQKGNVRTYFPLDKTN